MEEKSLEGITSMLGKLPIFPNQGKTYQMLGETYQMLEETYKMLGENFKGKSTNKKQN